MPSDWAPSHEQCQEVQGEQCFSLRFPSRVHLLQMLPPSIGISLQLLQPSTVKPMLVTLQGALDLQHHSSRVNSTTRKKPLESFYSSSWGEVSQQMEGSLFISHCCTNHHSLLLVLLSHYFILCATSSRDDNSAAETTSAPLRISS